MRASDARDAEVLGRLQRQPGARAAEEARGERVEPLDAAVSLGRRQLGEAEVGGGELDVGARPRERRGELVVVPRRVGGRIGEDDAHGGLE